MHLTLGTAALEGGVRTSQAVFYALAFFPGRSSRTGWLDGFAVPAPAQVTQTVGQFLAKQSKSSNIAKS